MKWLVPVLLALALLASGCFHTSAQSRTADVLPAGRVSAGYQVDVASLAFAGKGEDRKWWGARSHPHPMMMLMPPLLMGNGFFHVGVGANTELGVRVGVQELAGEIRYGLTQQGLEGGAGVSTALSVSGGWRPFMVDDFPHMQAGLDISRRFDGVVPHANVYVSYGPQDHAAAGPSYDCSSFGQPGCGEYGPSLQYYAARRELRLHTVIGASFLQMDDTGPTGHTFDVGIAPWFTLDSQQVDGCFFGACDLYIPWEGEIPSWGLNLIGRYGYVPYE